MFAVAAGALILTGCLEDGSITESEQQPTLALSIVSGEDQEGPAGETLSDPLVVRAEIDGEPIEDEVVNWVVVEGGGEVFAGVSQTDSNGEAREWWTLGDPGPQRLEVRAVDPTSGEKRLYGSFEATALDPDEAREDEEDLAPRGLVSHHRLDEGTGEVAHDASGQGNHGEISGAAWTSGITGEYALELDGERGVVRVPNSSSLDITGDQFTLSAWVRPRDLQGDGDAGIISKAHEGSSNEERYHLGIRRNGQLDVRRYSHGNLARLRTGEVVEGEWQHIAAVYDGSHLIAYVNGEEVGRTSASGELDPSDRDLLIGKRYNDRFFTGAIDDPRVYDRALSQAEVEELVSSGGDAEGDVDSEVASVEVSPNELTMEPGDQQQLEASASDEDGNTISTEPTDYTWESSNEDVATVDDAGEVTAVSEGSATITATLDGGSGRTTVEVAERDDHDASDPDVDHVVDGFHSGFTVPAGETWEVKNVETDANVIVLGTLLMRPGSSLTFVDVDESRFVGGGLDVIEEDVGLWVMEDGVLDLEGTPVQGWNRTGTHPTWKPEHEYVRAPFHQGEEDAKPWSLGDPVPCFDFAGEEHCAEVANLTRDVVIQSAQNSGKAHIFIRSTQPSTIRFVKLRRLGPEFDPEEPDGRYGLHFHHAMSGSRGSIVEGVVAREMGDHAYAPHESEGIRFFDTVAYDVRNTPYWWDPLDRAEDITWERALAIQVNRGDRDGHGSLFGFRMGLGEGNACIECVAAGVGHGRAMAGFGWRDSSTHGPNLWLVDDAVAHNNDNAVYHWNNEPHDPVTHEVNGFTAFHNNRFGIEQGAYSASAHWENLRIFANRGAAIVQRGAPRHMDDAPGFVYRSGVIGGGSNRGDHAIEFRNMRNCGRVDPAFLFEDLDLVDFNEAAVLVDHDDCAHDDGHFTVLFRNVTVEGRDITADDFTIEAMPAGGRITVERADGTTFVITSDD